MDRHELRAWLRLVLAPRIGLGAGHRLLAALGSPQAVFDAPEAALAALVGPKDAKALRQEPEGLDARVEATVRWLDASPLLADGVRARHLLSLADARYPRSLLQTADPPLLVFTQGRLALMDAPAIAVVGSRNPTPQGHGNALAFAQALSEAGVTVVSGLARGIDGAAHEGALKGPGSTIAVVGTGLDLVYPKAHQALAARIGEQGLMLSEFVLGTPPLSPNFPRRNRIVAGLSRGTLVVEAALQSGSLITARLAAEMGREVLAIPGSIHSPQARGCHALIKQGAKLVETAQDVLEEMRLDTAPVRQSAAGGDPQMSLGEDADMEDPVLAAMGHDLVSQEALSARTGLGPAELGARLLELELAGHVARLPGQLFQRIARA